MEREAYKSRIRAVVRAIPAGKVASYGQVAHLSGRPNGARFVGAVMRGNNLPGMPCHRVVFSDGALAGGDAFGVPFLQRELLLGEGVVFFENGKVDMKRCRWDGISS